MRPLKPEEAKLWHLVGKTTKGLKGSEHLKLKQLENLLNPPKKTISNKSELSQTTADIAADIKPRINPNIPKPKTKIAIHPPVADIGHEKKIRRGNIAIDNTIDLHGMTQSTAENALTNFILVSYSQNMRNLLVITGKGVNLHHHSHEPFDMFAPSQRGILRQKLREWLNKPNLRKYISGISEANQKHGGGGAFYVRLKTKV